jgi:hypothetical protein
LLRVLVSTCHVLPSTFWKSLPTRIGSLFCTRQRAEAGQRGQVAREDAGARTRGARPDCLAIYLSPPLPLSRSLSLPLSPLPLHLPSPLYMCKCFLSLTLSPTLIHPLPSLKSTSFFVISCPMGMCTEMSDSPWTHE